MGSRGKKKRARASPQKGAARTASRLRDPVPNPVLGAEMRAGTRRGVLVGGTRYGSASQGEGCTFDLLDLDAPDEAMGRLRLPFLAHGFAPHPVRPHRAAVFEKWGTGGAFIDLAERTLLATIAPKPGHQFYGHGVFATDGSVVFAVETDLTTRAGVITVRDGASFAVIDEFPSFGQKPHDCMMIDGGAVLAITNGGGAVGSPEKGSVTFVSVAERKLLDRREIGSQRLNAGHIAMAATGDFVVVSAPREGLPELTSAGGVGLSLNSRPLTDMTRPAEVMSRIVGEALSVCIHEPSGHVVATHPYANLVTIWNLATQALATWFEIESPRGVALTLDGTSFVLSFGAQASTLEVDATTLERGEIRGRAVFGGSHLYTWAYPKTSAPPVAPSPTVA